MVPWHLRRGVDSEIMTVMFRAFIIIHRGLEVFQWFFVDFCWSIWVPSKEPTGGKPHVFLVSLLLNLISPRACYQLEKTSGQRNKVLSSIRRQEVCKTKVDDELGDGFFGTRTWVVGMETTWSCPLIQKKTNSFHKVPSKLASTNPPILAFLSFTGIVEVRITTLQLRKTSQAKS